MSLGRSRVGSKNYLVLTVAGVIMIGIVVLVFSMMAGPAPERNIYSNVSNREIKARVSRLVRDIRELVYEQKNRERQLLDSYHQKNREESRPAGRNTLRERWIRESDETHDSFMRAYKEKYWADAVLLRRELHRRLAKRARDPQQGIIYQHPTNALGVESIADDLELLSKSLPDD